MEQLLKINFPAKADRLCLIRALVKQSIESAGCSHELADRLVIAVNEACMNVIQHAYKGQETGEILLEILNNGENLIFRLEDAAEPVNLDCIKPRNLDEIRPGGLGTHFIREIMDNCEMGHLEGDRGNYLRMIKKIK